MERTGEITAVQDGYLEITICRPADCENCRKRRGNICSSGQHIISLRMQGEAKVGDKAVIRMSERTIAKASLIAYAIPLTGLFAGMILGEMLLPDRNSLGGILGGIAGLAASLGIIALTEKKRQKDPRWDAELVRIIPRITPNS